MCVVTAATQLQHLTSSAFYTNPELSQGCLPSATHMCVLTAATQLFQTLNITFLLHKSRAEPRFPAFCNKHVCVLQQQINFSKKLNIRPPCFLKHTCVFSQTQLFHKNLTSSFCYTKGFVYFSIPHLCSHSSNSAIQLNIKCGFRALGFKAFKV